MFVFNNLPRRVGAASLLLAGILLQSSCSFDAVAQFADKSGDALKQGQPILKDIENSCIRRQMDQKPYYGLEQADRAKEMRQEAASSCTEATKETPSLMLASQTLIDYFSAISQLASSGKTSVGKTSDAKVATSQAGKTAGSIKLMTSAGNIMEAIGKMATAGYRAKHLKADLVNAAPDVDLVLSELKKDVDVRYIVFLDNEQAGYDRRLSALVGDSPQFVLLRTLARDNESEHTRLMDAKRAAARDYCKAIDTILSGHTTLVERAGKLSDKDVPGLIQPNTDSLSKLALSIMQLFKG